MKQVYLPDTTISIKPTNLEKLNAACETLGLKKNRLLSILLNKMLREFTNNIEPIGHIRYQQTIEKTVIIHIGLSEQDYEQAQDLRRFTKYSVSYIIGYAIENYLDSLFANFSQKQYFSDSTNDCYRKKYSVDIKKEPCSIHFFVFWGEKRKYPLVE